jgi:hypothetical protein
MFLFLHHLVALPIDKEETAIPTLNHMLPDACNRLFVHSVMQLVSLS